ncbi:MAG: VanZ family protein [Gammaproteobacteria bacterium]|jgi:VanZ family protein|nr:VanZ family protein [Gammaproteobacteria bacterium]
MATVPAERAAAPLSPRQAATVWSSAWLAFGALFAVLYITLLPFRFFEDLTLAEAWNIYRDMEFGAMRPGARQQWVANVALFMPLGFCWMAWLASGVRSATSRVAIGAAVALFGLAVTASVEFIQAWIPLRTPSLIDMSGNFTGALAGVLAWALFAPRLPGWIARMRRGTLDRWLTLYVVVYVLAALVPFDFVMSAAEWRNKLASGHLGWWSAAAGCDGGLRCLARDLLEVLIAVPVGIWLGRRFAGRLSLAGLIAAGLACAVVVEAMQSLTLSGIGEGSAAVLRGFGILLGLVWQARGIDVMPVVDTMRRYGRTIVLLVAAPYLLLVFALDVGFSGIDPDASRAARVLADTKFLPFHYHYLVSEAAAIASIAQHALMYAPVGAAVWLWFAGGRSPRSGLGYAAGGAALLAALIETAKLLVPGRHPDYTDVLIAAVAAGAAWAFLVWVWRRLTLAPEPDAGVAPVSRFHAADAMPPPGRPDVQIEGHAASGAPLIMRVTGVVLGALVLIKAASWPILPLGLVLGLLAYAWLLWRRPEAWLLVIPALVPTLNLSHLSGRFFFDELDLFVLATLAVAAWRWNPGAGLPRLPRLPALGLAAFAAAMALGVLIALYPWRLPDAWDWTHYTSPYNALRAAKGFVWAVLLFGLLTQSTQAPARQLRQWFVPGMTLGLALGVFLIIRERLLYPGLFDFDSIYRISGAFADMHVGGPSIETWLVMTAGFALLWGWWGGARRLLPALALFIAALYALAVTYARAGYLGMAAWACVAVFVAASAIASRRSGRSHPLRMGVAAAVLAAGSVAVMAQLAGGFIEQRLTQVRSDLDTRINHWSLAIDLARADGGINWWGQGLGSFPRAYLLGNPAGRVPENFGALTDGEGPRLRLGGGDSLYINQRIDLPRDAGYRLQLEARAAEDAAIAVFVCEKHLRYSYGCVSTGMTVPASTGPHAWNRLEWRFSVSGEDRFAGLQRGMTLALAYHKGSGPVEITGLRLVGEDGSEHLRNGDFSQGMDHWYASTDNLLPWRIENQWLQIWFELGWIGLAAFVLLIASAAGHLAARAAKGNTLDGFCLAAVTGVLVIGLFSTVFWSPRLMMLFFLLLLASVAMKQKDCGAS